MKAWWRQNCIVWNSNKPRPYNVKVFFSPLPIDKGICWNVHLTSGRWSWLTWIRALRSPTEIVSNGMTALRGGFPFVIVLNSQNFIHSIFEPPVFSTQTVGGVAMQDYNSQPQCMIAIIFLTKMLSRPYLNSIWVFYLLIFSKEVNIYRDKCLMNV